jgi:hypothetical protein
VQDYHDRSREERDVMGAAALGCNELKTPAIEKVFKVVAVLVASLPRPELKEVLKSLYGWESMNDFSILQIHKSIMIGHVTW